MIYSIFKLLLLVIIFFNITLNAKELEKVSLQLQWLDQFQFAGYYMAKEKGFYKNVGLEVELKKFDYSINTLKEVEEKRATYGIGRSALIIDKSNGANIKLLASVFQSSPSILLTTNKKIKDIKDFIGKRIMTTQDASLTVSINAMAMKSGVKINDMKIQEHSFNIEDLINKKTDLMSSYISNEPFILKELDVEYTVFDPKEHGFDFYSDILFTSQEEIREHKQRTINFTTASIRGWEYAFENIDETVDIILKKYNPQNKSKAALIFEAKELKKLAYFKTKKLGTISKNKVQRIYDIYNVLGLVNNVLDTNELIFKYEDSHINLTKSEQEYLNTKKIIKVCTMPNAMPYSKIIDDDFVGISADFIELISTKLNLDFELTKTTSWSQSHQYIKEGKCDLLPIVEQTPKRDIYLNFTDSYISTPLIIATTIDKMFIPDIKDISDKKLGIAKGYSYIETIKKQYPNINFVIVSDSSSGLEKVANGELYGFIGDLASTAYKIQLSYYGILKISGHAGPDIQAKMGVAKKENKLFNILNKCIDEISQDEKQFIINKWLSVKEVNEEMNYTLLRQLVGIFMIILVIVAFFIIKQNKHQKELEDSKEQLQKYLDLMSDGFAIINAQTKKFVFCNKTFEKITGYKFHQLQNMVHSEIHPKESLARVEDQMEKQAKGIIITAIDIPILHKNGDMSVYDIDSNVIHINGTTYYFGSFKSKSKNIQTQYKLRLENKRLKSLITEYEKQLK